MAIHIGRREFVVTLGGAAATWPLVTRAQQAAMLIVAFVSSRSPDARTIAGVKRMGGAK